MTALMYNDRSYCFSAHSPHKGMPGVYFLCQTAHLPAIFVSCLSWFDILFLSGRLKGHVRGPVYYSLCVLLCCHGYKLMHARGVCRDIVSWDISCTCNSLQSGRSKSSMSRTVKWLGCLQDAAFLGCSFCSMSSLPWWKFLLI